MTRALFPLVALIVLVSTRVNARRVLKTRHQLNPHRALSTKRAAILSVLALPMLLFLPLCAAGQACWIFHGELNGDKVVPPTVSTGEVSVTTYFAGSCMECAQYAGDDLFFGMFYPFDHVEGVPTYADLCVGKAGENGPLLHRIPLEGVSFPFETLLQFDTSYCAALMDTSIYVVVASDLYPNGEVRGQLVPQEPIAVFQTTWGRVRSLFK